MQKGFSLLAFALGLFALCLPASAQTYTFSTLYNFRSDSQGSGPSAPSALIVDTAGNVYGTTMFGGKEGAGTVYALSAGGGAAGDPARQYEEPSPDPITTAPLSEMVGEPRRAPPVNTDHFTAPLVMA